MIRLQSCHFAAIVLLELLGKCVGEYCLGFDHVCHYPHRCCDSTCCVPQGYNDYYSGFRWSIWNMWYFWFIVIFILTSCFGGCGYWRRRQLMLGHNGTSRDMFSMFNFYGRWGGSRASACPRGGGHPDLCAHQPAPRTMALYNRDLNTAASQMQAEPAQYSFPAPPAYAEAVSKVPTAYGNLPPYSSLDDVRVDAPEGDMPHGPIGGMTVPPPYSPPTDTAMATSVGPCPPYSEATFSPAPGVDNHMSTVDSLPTATLDGSSSAQQDTSINAIGLRVHLPPI